MQSTKKIKNNKNKTEPKIQSSKMTLKFAIADKKSFTKVHRLAIEKIYILKILNN